MNTAGYAINSQHEVLYLFHDKCGATMINLFNANEPPEDMWTLDIRTIIARMFQHEKECNA